MSRFEYVINTSPCASDDKIIRDGIVNFNNQTINEKATHFSVLAKDGNQIIGGALVWEHSDALYIDVLWCDENHRKKGVGTKLISMIDDVAINKKLSKIFVDTYAFQAQTFYQKHGFYCIGTIPKYLLGHDRMFMRKNIP
ncbi:TPA: GNAT family N-acetyltransferase [Legionella pneumophila]|nr:GNAT family N-acetyltransferase [Legionella pneumophila]HAU0297541.1 GNAT family N-acetyltransferase [Legionella pneumophila]